MTKRKAYAYIIVFFLLFLAPTALYALFGSYLEQANYEQRVTTTRPDFTLSGLEEYPAAFERYYNDNLPFRSQLIEANHCLDYFVFQQSPVRKVVLGQDGWMFYNPEGEDGDPIRDSNGKNRYSDEQLAQMAENLVAARDALSARGKEFIVFIAPNKEGMYSQYLPARFRVSGAQTKADQVVEYLKANTDLTVVYPKEALKQAMVSHPDRLYYYKTDTHWNLLGGYLGARSLLDCVGISLPQEDQLTVQTSKNFSGDLANMTGMAKYLEYEDYYAISGYADEKTYESISVLPDSNGLLVSNAQDGDSRNIFVVRDSFSTAMMPVISPFFKQSTYVHMNIYSPAMLEEYPSDVVVVEVVERYLDYLSRFCVE